jgi:hypothetical protein
MNNQAPPPGPPQSPSLSPEKEPNAERAEQNGKNLALHITIGGRLGQIRNRTSAIHPKQRGIPSMLQSERRCPTGQQREPGESSDPIFFFGASIEAKALIRPRRTDDVPRRMRFAKQLCWHQADRSCNSRDRNSR